MYEHLIFFDAECPFCHSSVHRIIEIDVKKHFLFAPLNGETAQNILIGPQSRLKKMNSLVLVEEYDSTERKFWIKGKGALRTFWLIGNGWGLVGVLHFLPKKLIDPIYDWFAAHRHQFKLKIPTEPGPKDRFLS